MVIWAAQQAVEAPPWWGTPALTAGAVLIGALVSFLATYLSKRIELRHAELSRWDKELLDTSSQLVHLTFKMSVLGDPSSRVYIEDVNKRRAEAYRIIDDAEKLAQHLMLLSDLEFSGLGSTMLSAARNESGAFLTHTPDVPPFSHAFSSFMVAAHEKLRIVNVDAK